MTARGVRWPMVRTPSGQPQQRSRPAAPARQPPARPAARCPSPAQAAARVGAA